MSKEDYINMSKFMFIQICQQAEMSIHLSQFGDESHSDVSGIKHGRSISNINNSGKKKLKSAGNNAAGNPMFETGQQSARKTNTKLRSANTVLTLDKDVNELQMTFEMFKD